MSELSTFYADIKDILAQARNKAQSAVNSAWARVSRMPICATSGSST